jgi:hypothetical protein
MIPLAHVGGLPLEETVVQLAPAVPAAVMALCLAGERMRRWATRLAHAFRAAGRPGGRSR